MSVSSNGFRESNQRTVFGRVVRACAEKHVVTGWIAPILLWLVVLAGYCSHALAGCHSLGEDWYRDYHHGHRANSVWDLVSPTKAHWQAEQMFVYEDGEMRAISNPLPERCQGPQCQESPTQHSLDGIGVVQQHRSLTVAIRSPERFVSQRPASASDWIVFPNLKTLAGFPASLEEPPR